MHDSTEAQCFKEYDLATGTWAVLSHRPAFQPCLSCNSSRTLEKWLIFHNLSFPSMTQRWKCICQMDMVKNKWNSTWNDLAQHPAHSRYPFSVSLLLYPLNPNTRIQALALMSSISFPCLHVPQDQGPACLPHSFPCASLDKMQKKFMF